MLGSCLSDLNKLMVLWYYGILLPEEGYKIKSIIRINTLLMNSNVEEKEFSNDIVFSTSV